MIQRVKVGVTVGVEIGVQVVVRKVVDICLVLGVQRVEEVVRDLTKGGGGNDVLHEVQYRGGDLRKKRE